MTYLRRFRVELLTFVLALLCAPVILLAQDPGAPPDFVKVGVDAILALTPVLSVAVVWLLKAAWSKIPASFLFVAAPVAGVLVNYALSWIAGHQGNYSPLIGAALGALAVYLREFASTLVDKGIFGRITLTKGLL